MSVRSTLARGRRAAGSLMLDLCVIKRKTGQELDPVTNVYTPTYTPVYDDPDVAGAGARCRLKSSTTAGTATTAGDQNLELRRYELEIPWDAPTPVQVNDVVEMTKSDDAWVKDRELTVIAVDYSGTTTKRRMTVEDRA